MPKKISKHENSSTDYTDRTDNTDTNPPCRCLYPCNPFNLHVQFKQVTRRTQRTAEDTEAIKTPHAPTQAPLSFSDRMSRMKKQTDESVYSILSILSILSIPFILSKTTPFPRIKPSNQPDGPPQTLRFSAFSAFLPLLFGCGCAALRNPCPKKPSATHTATHTYSNCGI